MTQLAHRDAADIVSSLEAHHLLALLDEVCSRRGVLPLDVCGTGRTQGVVRARQELWWLIRNHPDRAYSHAEIARIFHCDHSTVLSGIRAHRRRQPP